MKIGWILGWAVPESWFASIARAAMPRDEHRFFFASPDAVARLAASGPFDWVVGYSLGSLLLLAADRKVDAPSSRVPPPRVALLAPIFTFPFEAGMGGKVRRGQLKHLGRQLAGDPFAPVGDFYRFAGLDISDAEIPNLDPAALRWGIEQLDKTSVPPRMPSGWRAWCGADDALLDAGRLHELDPAVTVTPAATHHPAGLIRAFADEVGS
jgi:hypothetical protein